MFLEPRAVPVSGSLRAFVQRTAAGALAEEAVLRVACEALVAGGPFGFAWAGLRGSDGSLSVQGRAGLEPDPPEALDLRSDGASFALGAAARAMREGRAVVVQDAPADPSLGAWRDGLLAAGLRACVAVPIREGGAALGVVEAFAASLEVISEAVVAELEDLAGVLGLALREARARAEAERAERAGEASARLLELAEARLRDGFMQAPLAIVVTDLEGRVVEWNPAAERLWGWSAQEAVGAFAPWVGQADRPAFLAQLREAAAGERPPPVRRTGQRRDGSSAFVRLAYSVAEDAAGRRFVTSMCDDITAELEAERALQVSLRRYEELFRGAPLSIVVTDLEGRVVEWNPASEALWGWTAEEAVGASAPWVDEEDRLDFLRLLRAVSAGDRPVHSTRERRRRDGSVVQVRKSYSAFEDASGRQLVAILSDDMTAQVAAEQALQRSLARLGGLHALDRAILAAGDVGEIAAAALRHLADMVPFHRASLVLFDHEAGAAILTATVDPEVAGPPAGTRVPLQEVVPPGMLEAPAARVYTDPASDLANVPIARRLAERGATAVAWVPLLVGSRLIGAIDVAGKVEGLAADFLAVARELADPLAVALRHSAYVGALEERERRIRVILEGAPNPVMTVGRDGLISYANPAALQAFAAPDGLESRPILELIPGDARAAHVDRLATFVDGARDYPAAHCSGVEAVRLDGSTFPVDISRSRIDAAEGPELLITLVDLSEQFELERRLAHAERVETLGQFAAILAHDVRTYINAIGWSAEALARGLPEDHELRADARLIGEAVMEAREMIGSVLEFARPAPVGGSTQLARHVSRVGGIISRLLGPDVSVEVAIPEDLPRVALAPASLTQVLVNLATNAREAMPQGGLFRIAARLLEPGGAGGAQVGPRAGGVRLEVSDSGPGMDAATATRVFEPFFTTRAARDGGESGVGLGLASVHLAVTRAGGSVRVESAPGAGTTFIMDLPLAQAAG